MLNAILCLLLLHIVGCKSLLIFVSSFNLQIAVVPQAKVDELRQLLVAANLQSIEILADEAGLIAVAEHPEVDVVMAAIVGAAGLMPTLAAVKSRKACPFGK